MRKLNWGEARFIFIVVLAIAGFLFAILACENEPVGFPTQDCCTKAYITVNNDYPASDPNYHYEGDLVEWFDARDWEDGDSFIMVLEDCETEHYYGKYIIRMID